MQSYKMTSRAIRESLEPPNRVTKPAVLLMVCVLLTLFSIARERFHQKTSLAIPTSTTQRVVKGRNDYHHQIKNPNTKPNLYTGIPQGQLIQLFLVLFKHLFPFSSTPSSP